MTNLANEKLRRYGLFDARVPRFTSYPPATRFTNGIGGAQSDAWLKQTPPGAEISLYVHVPFCRRLCWFCACRTQGTKTDGPLERYVGAVLTEARRVRALLPRDIRIARLHLGGGTPTILPPALSDRLLSGLDAQFGLGGLDEFSVEIDPTEIDADRIDVLAAAGMTRASIGVQDFDPRVQKAIGRAQSVGVTQAAVDLLRARGIEALNVDLLYGLPFQTGHGIEQTLASVLSLAPRRLALYGYAHVPWMSKRQALVPSEAIPGAEARLELFDRARRRLTSAGFWQIGIDHFARPGDGLFDARMERRLARNFQGYTDDRTPRLIGLGASAISRFPQGFAQNLPATAQYQDAVMEGASATSRGIALDGDSRVRAALIEQLMCYHAIRLDEVEGAGPRAADWLERLAERFPDAIRFDGTALALEGWARPLVRVIAARLADTESDGQAAYSTAI